MSGNIPFNYENILGSGLYGGNQLYTGPISSNSGNATVWASLFPWTGVNHWGGGTQLTTMDHSYSSNAAYVSNLIDTKNVPYICNTLQGLAGQNGTGMTQAQMQSNVDSFAKQTGEATTKGLLKLKLEPIVSQIDSLISQIDGALKGGKLTAAEKTKLEAKKAELEAMKSKVQDAINNIDKQDVNAATDTVNKLTQDFTKASNDVNTLAKSIVDAHQNDGKSDGSKKSDGSSASDGSSDSGATNPDGAADGGNTPATRNLTKAQQAAMNYQLVAVCNALDKAMDGMGTDYDAMKATLADRNNVTEDNILELVDKWNSTVGKTGDYKDDKKGFIESLMDECEGDQKEEIASGIIDLLAARAEKDGIDVSNEVALAKVALKSNWIGWRDDDKICDAVNSLIKRLKTSESAQRVQIANQKAQKEAQETRKKQHEQIIAQQKQNKLISDAKTQFIKDVKAITGRQLKGFPANVTVKVENDKVMFTVRIKGKDYTAESYRELHEAIMADKAQDTEEASTAPQESTEKTDSTSTAKDAADEAKKKKEPEKAAA